MVSTLIFQKPEFTPFFIIAKRHNNFDF